MGNVTKKDIQAWEAFTAKLVPEAIASMEAMALVSEQCTEITGYSLLGHKGAVGILDNELLNGNHNIRLIFARVKRDVPSWSNKTVEAFAKRTKDHVKWLAGMDFSHGGGLPSRLAKVGGDAVFGELSKKFATIRPYMDAQVKAIIGAAA